MYFDPVYLIFALPGLLLALWAQLKTKTAFEEYSRVSSHSGLTGAQAAAKMLEYAGVTQVKIEETSGFLSDHYDPVERVLRLSPDVYRKNSLAAIGVACHEAGHAIQHFQNYRFLVWRSALVPVINLASPAAYIIFVLGFILSSPGLLMLGIGCFAAAVVFALVTLPVEYDASRRAAELISRTGMLAQDELPGAKTVLNAAFLTYVAAAVSALLTLLYYLYRSGLLSRRD